jgi:hypothetical protein
VTDRSTSPDGSGLGPERNVSFDSPHPPRDARIAGKEAFLVAPTRYLGHYVVGRLATRLDVEVLLSDTPGGGVSALVTLPAKILAPD